MVKSITIKLNKTSDLSKIEKDISDYVNNHAEDNKIDESKYFFIKSIKQLINEGQNIYQHGGEMTFKREIKYEGLSIIVDAKFLTNESFISKILNLFNKWEKKDTIDKKI